MNRLIFISSTFWVSSRRSPVSQLSSYGLLTLWRPETPVKSVNNKILVVGLLGPIQKNGLLLSQPKYY